MQSQVAQDKLVNHKALLLGMEHHHAERAGYLLPVAAQLGHFGGPVGFGTLHAPRVAAALVEDRSSIGGIVVIFADLADHADLEATAAHASAWLWPNERLAKMILQYEPRCHLLWKIFA